VYSAIGAGAVVVDEVVVVEVDVLDDEVVVVEIPLTRKNIGVLTRIMPFESTVTLSRTTVDTQLDQGPPDEEAHSTLLVVPGAMPEATSFPPVVNDSMYTCPDAAP
jgi:hypothetical protein